MTTYTKRVTIKYASNEDRSGNPDSAFSEDRFKKAEEMVAAGKADTVVTLGNLTAARKFINQAAAEEYLNFILASATTHGVTIVESNITDC